MFRQARARVLGLLMWALVAEAGAAVAHHVYGGLHYRTPDRLWMALGFLVAIAVTLGLLSYHSKRGRGAALMAAIVLIVSLWILSLGLFEGGYNHAYKCVLYFAGVTPERVVGLHPVFMTRDFIYPPDNAIFELTGVLQLITACAVAALTCLLLREAGPAGGFLGGSVSETREAVTNPPRRRAGQRTE